MYDVSIRLIVLLILGAGSHLDASAQTLGQAEPISIPVLRLLLGLLICLGLVVLIIFMMRRSKQGPLSRGSLFKSGTLENDINVISVRRVTAEASVCLFQHDKVEYLIFVSGSGSLLLREKPIEGSE